MGPEGDAATSASLVKYRLAGAVALLTINRPQVRNAVDRQVATELQAALDRLESADGVRCGVLTATVTGDRPVFCAGQDLKAFGRPEGLAVLDRGGFAGLTNRRRTKPLIAAVDGLATAGGCEMVLACDLVVASPRSAFALAEVARGLIPGSGGLHRLARIVGSNMAMRVALTADPLPARRAYELGLVTDLVEPDQVVPTALALASRIAGHAPLAVAEARALIDACTGRDDADAEEAGRQALDRLMRSDDLKEGLRAFREGRSPQWGGR
jgi:enoyl-CoA hydratase/carnithine racemase